jgi:ATP-dependent 26S proteasome regulatory subunit
MGHACAAHVVHECGAVVIEVFVDAKDALATITDMEQRLTAFPEDMSTELTEWQTNDMRRTQPNTTREEKSVYTIIVQHTPSAKKASTGGVMRQRRKVREAIVRKLHTPRVLSLTKPILRPHLYEQLCSRMAILMKEKLKWR